MVVLVWYRPNLYICMLPFLRVGFRLMHNYRKTALVIVTAGSVAVFFLLVLILD
jgi:hypothetical protein